MKERREKILLWGAGKVAKDIMSKCVTIKDYFIIGIIDNDSKKTGEYFEGYPILKPDAILQVDPDVIVVLTDYYEEICEQIMMTYPGYANKIENKYYFFKKSILKRYENETEPEKKEVLLHIKQYGLKIFNYSFTDNYEKTEIKVYFDEKSSMYYVYHYGKRMYFSSNYKNEDAVRSYYQSILIEQDEESPHRYLSKEFDVGPGDVVIDAGAAEGNFSLEVIDRISRLYIIEADENWIEALKATFAPYADKVTIIQAYCSSYDEGKFRRLDGLIKEKVNFIKMDIEGNEWDALLGSEKLIEKSSAVRLAVCCYHADYDQTLIENVMDNMEIMHCTSRGVYVVSVFSKAELCINKIKPGIGQRMEEMTLRENS